MHIYRVGQITRYVKGLRFIWELNQG